MVLIFYSTKKVKEFFKYLFSDGVREKMKSRYLSNPDYNFEKVNRASMACGPLVKWATAQVNIRSRILGISLIL